jgi:biotin carboxyl carrier protein
MEPIGHAGLYSLMVDGRVYEVFAEKRSDGLNIIIGRQLYAVGVESPLRRSTEDAVDEQAEGADWMVVSPMTGTVVEVMVQAGQQVRAGDVLLVLEAMKMNSEIRAQRAGTVEEVLVQPGQLITRGTTMLVLR